MRFSGQTITMGVCGGIAAYRACDLLRDLHRAGLGTIYPVLSTNAERFVSPLTLTALGKTPCLQDAWSVDEAGVPWHISLAQRSEALLLVSATANTLAKLAHGLADELLSTTALTFTGKPIVIAPAMNTRMWENPMTQRNVETLKALPTVSFVEPADGLLACGETGTGHIASNELIQLALYKALHPQAGLYAGKKVLVTLGGTQAPLDPVRVLGNRSSGKMGRALADELYAMGAEVTVVTALECNPERPYPQHGATTAEAMRETVLSLADEQDAIFKVAAVSDFVPVEASTTKLKKSAILNHSGEATISLKAAPDILAELGKRKRPDQLLVGFAAETDNLLENAQRKLREKHVDVLVLNDVSRADSGMGHDENEVTLLFPQGEPLAIPRQPKWQVARQLLVALFKRI